MCTRFRSMSALMLTLISVLLELNLYIILASSLSVSHSHHVIRSEKIKSSDEFSPYYHSSSSQRSARSQPTAMMLNSMADSASSATNQLQQHPSPPLQDAILRDNKMDDLFLSEAPLVREQPEDIEQANGGDESMPQIKHNNLASIAYNSINLDNSIELEPEMLINNHQQSISSSSYETPTHQSSHYTTANLTNPLNPIQGQHSRHYNSYQAHTGPGSMQASYHNHPQNSNGNNNNNYNYHRHHHKNHHHQHNLHQNPHYGKYSPNMFANNYNLNYIHGFLTSKPSLLTPSSSNLASSSSPASISSPSSLPPTYSQHSNLNGNSLGLANQYNFVSSPVQQQTNGGGFVSSYVSASSSLSAAVNNLQQTIAQKQQQLASINSQLQNLANTNSIPATPSGASGVRDSALQLQGSNATFNNNNSDENELQGPVSKCGRQQVAYREPRVVGGNSTYEGEFPWAVSIQRHGNHHCGGVIVDKRWILTAAHCVRSQLVGNLAVRTGGHTLSRTQNGLSSHLEKDYQVEQIIMHDDFSRYDNLTVSQPLKSSTNTNNADIALLKLKHDIHWNDLAWPVCFPDRDAGNFSGHDAIVIGWGKLNEKSEEFSNELQKVKLTIIDNKVCQNWFRQAGRDMPIDDRIICAGFKHGGKDACHGDSGGPLLSRINGQYVVVGVVSTGIGCARPLLPGLYSRVSSYISWIGRHITI